MKLVITIDTGNDAMQTDDDVAQVLKDLARRVKERGMDNVSKVMDRNGNKVGTVETYDD